MDPTQITTLVAAVGGLCTAAGVAGTRIFDRLAGSRRKDSSLGHDQLRQVCEDLRSEIRISRESEAECIRRHEVLLTDFGRLQGRVEQIEDSKQICSITVDDSGVILDCNHGATLLLGWLREDLIGQPNDKVVPERFRERHHKAFREAVNEGRGPKVGEVTLRDLYARHRNGSEIPVTIALRSAIIHGKRTWTADLMRRTS